MRKNIDLSNPKLIHKYFDLTKNYLLIQNKKPEESKACQNSTLINPFNYQFFNEYQNNKGKGNALNPQIMKINNKKLKCKTFYQKGYCPLGSKCKFQHEERKYTNFSYFYIRQFLLKNFGFPSSEFNSDEGNSGLYNKRLEVFQSLTNSSNNCEKNDENEKYDSSCDDFENTDIIIDFN